jgi:AraC-like DNA-binding protein
MIEPSFFTEAAMHAKYENRYYVNNLNVVAFESRNMSFFAHWHTDVELICVYEGSLMVGINNESRILHKGDMAICSSGDIHFYDYMDMESIIRLIIFRPELIDCAGGWPRAFAFSSPFLQEQCYRELYSRFNSAFETVLQETEKTDQVSSMLIRSSLLSLCGMLTRAVPIQPLTVDKATHRHHRLKAMQDVLSFIECNFMENIRLEDAAEVANMSVCHFSRQFGSIAGMGFKSYLNQLRVNRAEDLLKNSEDSITEIAYKCGFGSIRTFNRAFISSQGMPPSKIRL